MGDVVLRYPNRTSVENPSVEDLVRLITGDDSFLEEPSFGDTCLIFRKNGNEKRLVIYLGQSRGAVTVYCPGATGWMALDSGEPSTFMFEIFDIAGSEIFVPVRNFVDRNLALDAAIHFLQAGEMKPDLSWEQASFER